MSGETDTDMDIILQDIKDKSTRIIKDNPKADVALLDILTKHVVTSSPADDAVEQAMDAIKRLVDEKVRP